MGELCAPPEEYVETIQSAGSCYNRSKQVLLLGCKMANREQPFRQHHVTRALKAAAAAGVANPSVRIRTPGGTEYHIGGEVTAPKKHTTAAVAKPPPTRAAGRSRRGG